MPIQFEKKARPIIRLQIKLDTVLDRIVLRFANSIREQSLITIPDALDAKLDAVEDRVVLRFANTKRLSPPRYTVCTGRSAQRAARSHRSAFCQ